MPLFTFIVVLRLSLLLWMVKQEDKLGGACMMQRGDEKCVQNFGWKI
jgi:hypothetical protein